jgi:hypothetical protein
MTSSTASTLTRGLAWCALLASTFAAPSLAQEIGISGELERTAQTSPDEKRAYADTANAEIDAAVRTMTRIVDTARRDGAAEQIQCANTKLTAGRALREVSESAAVAMRARLDAGDLERADHEFRKIAVALSKARMLLAEAERCGDSGALRSGQTTLVVEGGEVGSDADTQSPEYPLEFDVDFDPPQASPFF